MSAIATLPSVLAASAGEDEGGSFLVSPDLGLMLWTLLVFGISMFLLSKFAFPRIATALDERQRKITDSIDAAERERAEAEQLAADYREQLQKARAESEEIIARARRSADQHLADSKEAAKKQREEILDQAKSDIAAETRRAVGELREQVATLTVEATAKVTRKSLTDDEQRRLLDEALGEIDFSQLTTEGGR
ncbi:F0F1 ATP synthase subunit B [Patulibacter brassicae]|jgi:F-type H+-transporting ATPase subunit b|uniref:ATP synthase subunit b n=1 Tax=Patulibacter brassicae TaxID=1705717 RepID=A0ABU4VK10_9ACTN|nr:F0F1 ATP synthase subunit B [Patulibacter brassicae]MDX8151429.1 F0F1 ATP synthase subunit B [Patulibacter brassicae]